MDSFPHFPPPANPTGPPSSHPTPPLPPPPFHPVTPPLPPPPPFHPVTPPPPPYSPDNGPTVIVIVFISFGCLLFLAFCLFALCCVVKRQKKRMVQETDVIRTDKHVRVKEAIVEGPCGPEAIVLSIEEDKKTEEEISRNEKVGVMHTAAGLETGQSSSNSGIDQSHHSPEHKH